MPSAGQPTNGAGWAARAAPIHKPPSRSARTAVPAKATDAISGCLFKLHLHDGSLPTIRMHWLAEAAESGLAAWEMHAEVS